MGILNNAAKLIKTFKNFTGANAKKILQGSIKKASEFKTGKLDELGNLFSQAESLFQKEKLLRNFDKELGKEYVKSQKNRLIEEGIIKKNITKKSKEYLKVELKEKIKLQRNVLISELQKSGLVKVKFNIKKVNGKVKTDMIWEYTSHSFKEAIQINKSINDSKILDYITEKIMRSAKDDISTVDFCLIVLQSENVQKEIDEIISNNFNTYYDYLDAVVDRFGIDYLENSFMLSDAEKNAYKKSRGLLEK